MILKFYCRRVKRKGKVREVKSSHRQVEAKAMWKESEGKGERRRGQERKKGLCSLFLMGQAFWQL